MATGRILAGIAVEHSSTPRLWEFFPHDESSRTPVRRGESRSARPRVPCRDPTLAVAWRAMESESTDRPLRVVVYSSNREVRELVGTSLGRRPARDLPELAIEDLATEAATIRRLDQGDVDLVILDGEAEPGGMGIARQLKDEIFRCPPVLIITGRPQDAWLATWSRADAVVPRPISPFELATATVRLLRNRRASAPAS